MHGLVYSVIYSTFKVIDLLFLEIRVFPCITPWFHGFLKAAAITLTDVIHQSLSCDFGSLGITGILEISRRLTGDEPSSFGIQLRSLDCPSLISEKRFVFIRICLLKIR